MGSLPPAPKDIHVILAAVQFYGHVRPLLPLAKELLSRGYSVTFVSGSFNRKQVLTSVPNVDFVSFTGKADFDPDRLNEDYPDRLGLEMTAIHDLENIFYGAMHGQHDALEKVIATAEANGKKVVIIQDILVVGSMPMLLDSPGSRRVPVIGIGHMPLMFLSKDTAPFGTGMQSQGEETNMKMNEGAIQLFTPATSALKQHLKRYNCPRTLPSEFAVDNHYFLPDLIMQLCPPALEPPRGDLPSNIRFCGTLTGGNDKKPQPEWWSSFITNPEDNRPLFLATSGSLPGQNIEHLILPTIRTCSQLPVRLVVCAVHIQLPPDLALPPNVRWAQWIAFEEIFPYTSVIVSSGGYGGISQAFANGIPMILAGTTEDKVETGLRAEATGAAINLKTQTPSDEQVREAVEQMLRDSKYKSKAEEMRTAYKDCDAMGSIIGAVDELGDRFYSETRAVS